MSLLDKLERRFGFLAIPGLPRILVGFAALVFGLTWLLPGFTSMLMLDPVRIRHGEVWRLITYIFIPQATSPLWVLFALWFLWWVGEGLERAWGSFRLTLYFLVGMIGTTVAAFFFGSNFSNSMLLMSLFLAFAHFYPEEIIYILFILPVRIKWLAWIAGAFRHVAVSPDILLKRLFYANVCTKDDRYRQKESQCIYILRVLLPLLFRKQLIYI